MDPERTYRILTSVVIGLGSFLVMENYEKTKRDMKREVDDLMKGRHV